MKRQKGFTLVEIMIVVAIIGLLAAIAIPNFIEARRRAMQNSCIANLKQIEGAKQLWAMDTGAGASSPVALDNLVSTYIRTTPRCALSPLFNYGPNNMDVAATCANDAANHKL